MVEIEVDSLYLFPDRGSHIMCSLDHPDNLKKKTVEKGTNNFIFFKLILVFLT